MGAIQQTQLLLDYVLQWKNYMTGRVIDACSRMPEKCPQIKQACLDSTPGVAKSINEFSQAMRNYPESQFQTYLDLEQKMFSYMEQVIYICGG